MENKIPTAEEWLISFDADDMFHKHSVEEAMIEFAKLHVKAALKAAAKSAMFSLESGKGKVHFNVYPLTNIK